MTTTDSLPDATIAAHEVPPATELAAYRRPGVYVDCYAVTVPGAISQAGFVRAFYTTRLFKLERFLLATFAASPSTDADAAQLAEGRTERFAAWTVEGRTEREILLAAGPTRSWLMAEAADRAGTPATTLYFGSAVVPTSRDRDGQPTLGWPFHALLGFHKLYSRLLLGAAVRRLQDGQASRPT